MRNSENISRRRFLCHSAGIAASTIVAPYVIPSGVLAAPGRPGPNDRIGIGGIGVGRQGTVMMNQVAQCKGTRVVAVADANETRAREFAASLGGKVEAYQDYRKVLDRKDIDAIVTATPDHWRAIVCIHACQAAKDIYAEKPLSLTIREGRLIVRAVQRYGRVLQTGSAQRSMIANRVGCELVRSGRIGKITKVIGHNYPSPWEYGLSAQPVPAGLDWDLWCGPTEVVSFNEDLYEPRANPGWISFRPYSGGEMTGWGAHAFDQVQCALGMDEGGPIEVWTEGARFSPPTYTQAESAKRGDKACGVPKVYFRYPGDIVMELTDKGPPGGAIFIGDSGTITIGRGFCTSDSPDLAKELADFGPQGPKNKEERAREWESWLERHVQDWLDCIKTRQKPICDAEIGHRSATICHLGNIARWAGRKLRWDPVKETFPDDAEANQYLDRQRRKPYELPETI